MLELLNVCDHDRSATFYKTKRWSNKELSSSDLLLFIVHKQQSLLPPEGKSH